MNLVHRGILGQRLDTCSEPIRFSGKRCVINRLVNPMKDFQALRAPQELQFGEFRVLERLGCFREKPISGESQRNERSKEIIQNKPDLEFPSYSFH
jgi:hypothetical protein